MLTVFYILIFIAMWHLVFESVVAPMMRMHYRNQLFALRDDLRRAWISDQDKDDELYIFMQEWINNAIGYLHKMNFSFILALYREINNNAGLKRQSKNRLAVLVESKMEVTHKIVNQTVVVIHRAAFINSGGWLYLIVMVLPFVLAYSRVRHLIEVALAFPNKDARKLPPFGCGGTATA